MSRISLENNPNWHGGGVTVTCISCHKDFKIKASAILRGRGKYCSWECRYAGMFVIKACTICGKETRIKNSALLSHKGTYCSLKCRSIGYIKDGIQKGANNPRYIDGKCETKENAVRRSHKRRAAKLKNGGDYTLAEWESLCQRYGNKCLCCGRDDIKLTVDHVIPLVKGGINSIDNLQPLCKTCNDKKNVKVIDYRYETLSQ